MNFKNYLHENYTPNFGLREAKSNPDEVNTVVKSLEDMGYKVQSTKGNTISVLSKNGDRISDLRDIADKLKGLYNMNGSGSSVGRTEIGNVKVFSKPSKNGQVKVNKGIQFERDFAQALNFYINQAGEDAPGGVNPTYLQAIEKMTELLPDGFAITNVQQTGGENNKRPLHIDSKGIYCGDGSEDIGRVVSDITLKLQDASGRDKDVYLSLKSGDSVTFVNAGITKVLPSDEIKTGYISNPEGAQFLDMFGINNEEFCAVFNNYTGKSSKKVVKNNVDVTSQVDKTLMNKFIRSVIGYGYILVHEGKQGVDIINMDNAKMNDLASLQNVVVSYPTEGGAKRVDVDVACNGIDIKFNMRSKSGGVDPTHIMADYRFTK